MRAHAAVLVDVAAATVGSIDLAQDVVQEVFCWLWDTRERIEVHGSLRGYLIRAIRNRAYNTLRHERSQRNIESRTQTEQELGTAYTTNTGASDVDAADLRGAVDRALDRLPPRAREIFLLHVDHDLDYAEIAEALGISVGTVRTQMYRATKQLARWLGRWL